MINKLISATISLFVFLFPLFYLPLTPDSYEYNKMFLLFFVSCLLFLLLSIKIAIERHMSIYRSTFGIPLFLLFLFVGISTLVQVENKMIPLTTPLSTSTLLFGIFLYYLLVSLVSKTETHLYLTILVVDAIILSLYVLFQNLGILPGGPFSPAGNITATVLFLSIMGVYTLFEFGSTLKNLLTKTSEEKKISPVSSSEEISLDQETLKKYQAVFYGGALTVIGLAVGFLLLRIFGDQKPFFLPYSTGWTILLSVFENIKTFALGVGPTNFFTAFTLAKPISINSTSLWNIIFTTSSSFFFNLTTEAGFFAGTLFLTLTGLAFYLVIRNWNNQSRTTSLTLLFALFLQLLFPSSMSVFILTIIFLSFVASRKELFSINLSPLGPSANAFIFPSLFVFAGLLYSGGKLYQGEALFKKSLDALLNNEAGVAYNLQKEAIGLSPDIDRYHLAHSQTSLAIANNYASNPETSAEDTQKIPQLVQQSINEAKISINLSKTSINNWNNMAQLYTSLIDVAQGSGDWAKQSYEQLITLDPFNPNHRISFGGMYLRMKKWTEAEEQFRLAISLKPDFANAHYNLAYVLRQQKKFDEAYAELEKTLTFVSLESEDGQKVQKEMEDIKGTNATTSAQMQETQNEPQEVENAASPSATIQRFVP